MNSTRGRRSAPRPRRPPVSRLGGTSVVDVVVVPDATRRRLVGGPTCRVGGVGRVGRSVASSGSVVEVVDVVLVVDVVVVTSSTGIPLGTVSATVVVGAGSSSASTFTCTAYRGVGDQHHEAGGRATPGAPCRPDRLRCTTAMPTATCCRCRTSISISWSRLLGAWPIDLGRRASVGWRATRRSLSASSSWYSTITSRAAIWSPQLLIELLLQALVLLAQVVVLGDAAPGVAHRVGDDVGGRLERSQGAVEPDPRPRSKIALPRRSSVSSRTDVSSRSRIDAATSGV